MNFTEAIAEVVRLTKRPDKETEIASNLNKAISFFTLKANFSRDLVEKSIAIDATAYSQNLDLTSAPVGFVRFRKMKALRLRGQRFYLKPIDPEQLLTPKGQVQPNRYYILGQTLSFTSSVLDSYLESAYYQYPPILTTATDNDNHWMLDMVPWMITERAASQTFKSIGDETSATFYERSSMELFLTARRDFEDQIAVAAS